MKINAQQAALRVVLILISLGSIVISISGTENVNLPKFVAMGVAAGSGFAYWIKYEAKAHWRSYQHFLYSLIALTIAMGNSSIWSSAPVTQNLYGVLSRNTGVITGVCLGLIALFMFSLHLKSEFSLLIRILKISGLINLFYCIWVIVFRNFLGINDPFAEIESLLGNPDFISAFLGITMASVIARAFDPEISHGYAVASVLFVGADLAVMYKLGATQGFVVAFIGFAIVIFYKLKSNFDSFVVPSVYLFGFAALSVIGVLGALSKGPLSFLHENSVIFRGWYWGAAVTMGSTHPWTGVGLDSYGDWFTRARSLEAANSPLRLNEPNADSAHSVPLDFFASGGWPLLIAYLLCMAAVLISIYRFTRRNQKYDPIFVALAASWLCYQAQSLISLNQLGLAVWGWALGGALIAYELMTRPEDPTELKKQVGRKSKKITYINSFVVIGVGALIGFLVTVPPMISDIKWKRAVDSGNPTFGRQALERNYFNPLTAQQYISAIKIFSASKLPEDALRLSRDGANYYSDNIEIWKLYYDLPNISDSEKEVILRNLVRLDSRTYATNP